MIRTYSKSTANDDGGKFICYLPGHRIQCYLPVVLMATTFLSVVNFISFASCQQKLVCALPESPQFLKCAENERSVGDETPAILRTYSLPAENTLSNDAKLPLLIQTENLSVENLSVHPVDPLPSAEASEYSEYNFQRYFDNAPQCDEALSADQVDFTLVSQTSVERLWIMEYLCANWDHDISLAVYLEPQSEDTVESIREDLVQRRNCSADRLTVSTVGGYSKKDYPVNVLRNTALAAVKTSHVTLVDIDFWIPRNLYTELHRHAEALTKDPKLALVIPAFELKSQCSGDDECREQNMAYMPDTKRQLLDLWTKQRKASIFKDFYAPGHGSTRYNDWKKQSDDALLSVECIQSDLYEPYMAFRFCHDLPPFQEAFYGYGYNKYAWMKQTRRSGYHYKQIGGSYTLHYPHEMSQARVVFNGKIKKDMQEGKRRATSLYHDKLDRAFEAFLVWLNQTVPDETVVALCEQ